MNGELIGANSPLAEMPNVGPLLSLRDIEKRTGISYDRLVAYANEAKDLLGATWVKGAKGARYPLSSVGQFEALAKESVPPKGAAAFLKTQGEEPKGVIAKIPNEGAMISLGDLPIPLLAEAFAEGVRRGYLAVQEELLTAGDAAALLSVSPSTLRRHLPPVKVGRLCRWRRSDLLRFIEGLGR